MEKMSDTVCHVIMTYQSGHNMSPPQFGVKWGRPRLLDSYFVSPKVGICRNPPFSPVYCFSGNMQLVGLLSVGSFLCNFDLEWLYPALKKRSVNKTNPESKISGKHPSTRLYLTVLKWSVTCPVACSSYSVCASAQASIFMVFWSFRP